MNDVDVERLYAAVDSHLKNLLAYGHLPAEHTRLVRLAYMHGCAIMAEACGLDSIRFIRPELDTLSNLILPPRLHMQ